MTSLEEALKSAVVNSEKLKKALSEVLIGKEDIISQLVLAVFCGGHVLLEDVPGVGKTTLAKALSKLLSVKGNPAVFHRVQFTPDLLPYDLTGTDVFRPQTGLFEFLPGPVFCQVLLGDEINRATPKVQSALLEVMEEGQVTVGGKTRTVDPFFIVLATQNPIDQGGVFPLPTAQLDRFFMKISVGYPRASAERGVWLGQGGMNVLEGLKPLLETQELLNLRQFLSQISVAENLLDLVEKIIFRTREDKSIRLGLSTRAGLHWVRCARMRALIQGRTYAIGQDFKETGLNVLSHRLIFVDQKKNPQLWLGTVIEEEFARHEKS